MMFVLGKKLRPAVLAAIGMAIAGLPSLPAHAETSLVIRDFQLTHRIDQREPTDVTEVFRVDDGKAIAFARIWNAGQPVRLSFLWRRDEKTHASVPVTVGASPGWRTWSTVNLQPGAWRVALVDEGGAILAERTFTVEPAPKPPVIAPVKPAPINGGISFRPADDPFSAQVPTTATGSTR